MKKLFIYRIIPFSRTGGRISFRVFRKRLFGWKEIIPNNIMEYYVTKDEAEMAISKDFDRFTNEKIVECGDFSKVML